MSTTNPPRSSLLESIANCNRCVGTTVKSRFGVGLKTYKTIKATTQLVATLGALYAMHLGLEPFYGAALIAAILYGPEYAEAILTNAKRER